MERSGSVGLGQRGSLDPALFQRPPAEYGPVAMWFLNTHLEDEELRRQIGAMAAGGVGGIQVAARTGLQTPYLSERWFEVIRLIQDAAAEHGMPLWLADEFPYPSGASGGEVVLRHPEFRAWQVHATQLTVAPGEDVHAIAPGTVLLRACGVPLQNGELRWSEAIDLEQHVGLVQQDLLLFEPSHVYLTTRRFMSNAPRPTLNWHAPEHAERWEVWLIAAAEVTDYKFFGSYVDLCNPDASRLFLGTTYERYLARLGAERFSQLAGFFLDESHPQNWSWCLPEFFRRQHGYDLIPESPALWTDIGPRTARIRYDYRQSITELFDASFMRPVADWCEAHGVALSLEVPSTRNTAQRHARVPGIDPGHDKVGTPLDEIFARELPSFRGNLGFPASLAAQSRKPRVLDELFHSVGWSLTLQDMKAMLDRAAARGANLFAFHAFCYSIGGLRKWDAPPSEFEQNPYWPHFAHLAEYASRLAYALSRGRRLAPIAVLDPITSLWAHATLPGLQLDQTGQQVMHNWTSIMRELLAAQRAYDHLDPLMLAEATVESGRLHIGDAEYQVIVLPMLTNLEPLAWTKLEEFAAAGGAIVRCGSFPEHDSELNSGLSELPTTMHVSSIGELPRLLNQLAPADLEIVERNADLLLAQRRDDNGDLFFLANASAQEQEVEIALRVAEDASISRLDLESGAIEAILGSWEEDGRWHAWLAFLPYDACLLAVGARTTPDARPRLIQIVKVGMDGDWHVDLADDAFNVLRLDRFEFTVSNAEATSVVVEPKPLVNILRDIWIAGAHWPGQMEVQPVFGAAPRIGPRLPTTARYVSRFGVRALPIRALLCLEQDALVGDWRVCLNGQELPHETFRRQRRWSIDNIESPIAELLTVGDNELVVEVRADHASGGLLDAVFILGDFGVFFDEAGIPVVDAPPSVLRWSERHTSGFPFFSGTFRLRKHVAVAGPRGDFQLRLPDEQLMFAGVVEALVDGHPIGTRAWAPYTWDVPAEYVSSNNAFELTLRLTTTLVEQLEGKRYDAAQRRSVRIRP